MQEYGTIFIRFLPLKKKKKDESLKIFSRVVPLAIFPITTPVVCNCMVDIAR